MPTFPERRRRLRRDEAVLERAQEVRALALRELRGVNDAVARSAQVGPHDDLRQVLHALLELRLRSVHTRSLLKDAQIGTRELHRNRCNPSPPLYPMRSTSNASFGSLRNIAPTLRNRFPGKTSYVLTHLHHLEERLFVSAIF